MLILTIAVVTLLFIISFFLFDRDWLAPPTVVALVMLFGCLCCLYNEPKWELTFSANSLGLISAGIIATMLGGVIGVWLSNFPKAGSFRFIHETTKPEEVYVHPVKTFAIIFFQGVTLILILAHIRRITGISSIMAATSRYRELTGRLADVNDISLKMPFLTRNLAQFSKMIAVVYAYIVGNNLVAKKKKLTINWIPLVMYTITTFVQGDRSNMIRLWIVVLVTGYTIHRRSVGWRKSRETKKIIKMIALSVIAMGGIFVGFREVVGRSTAMDPLYYVTFYAGSPIAVLNQMWEAPITKPDIFGQRILFYFNQTATVVVGRPGKYNFYYPNFKSPNGSIIGNAPTAFRPAYVEFGLVGFILFFVFCGAFFTRMYCKSRKKRGNSSIDIHLLIYAYVAYIFFMYFYSTFFDFLSHTFIKFIIEWLLIRWVLVGWQFKQSTHYDFDHNRQQTSS